MAWLLFLLVTKDRAENRPEKQHAIADQSGPSRRSHSRMLTLPLCLKHWFEPCILAGSRPGDMVLDPFAGSRTVGVVAFKLGRKFIGTELNSEYATMANNRIRAVVLTLYDEVAA